MPASGRFARCLAAGLAVNVTTAPATQEIALIAASAVSRIGSMFRASAGSTTIARKSLVVAHRQPGNTPQEPGKGVRPSGPGTLANAAITSLARQHFSFLSSLGTLALMADSRDATQIRSETASGRGYGPNPAIFAGSTSRSKSASLT